MAYVLSAVLSSAIFAATLYAISVMIRGHSAAILAALQGGAEPKVSVRSVAWDKKPARQAPLPPLQPLLLAA
jgi:hypothetical protein